MAEQRLESTLPGATGGNLVPGGAGAGPAAGGGPVAPRWRRPSGGEVVLLETVGIEPHPRGACVPAGERGRVSAKHPA